MSDDMIEHCAGLIGEAEATVSMQSAIDGAELPLEEYIQKTAEIVWPKFNEEFPGLTQQMFFDIFMAAQRHRAGLSSTDQ